MLLLGLFFVLWVFVVVVGFFVCLFVVFCCFFFRGGGGILIEKGRVMVAVAGDLLCCEAVIKEDHLIPLPPLPSPLLVSHQRDNILLPEIGIDKIKQK